MIAATARARGPRAGWPWRRRTISGTRAGPLLRRWTNGLRGEWPRPAHRRARCQTGGRPRLLRWPGAGTRAGSRPRRARCGLAQVPGCGRWRRWRRRTDEDRPARGGRRSLSRLGVLHPQSNRWRRDTSRRHDHPCSGGDRTGQRGRRDLFDLGWRRGCRRLLGDGRQWGAGRGRPFLWRRGRFRSLDPLGFDNGRRRFLDRDRLGLDFRHRGHGRRSHHGQRFRNERRR